MSAAIPVIVYSLVIIVFTKEGPAPIDKMYDSRFDCQVAEGVMLTKARDEKDIIGWGIPADCVAVPENNKV